MKATAKAALFGGALFAAGMTTTADAQWNLDEVTSFHQVFAGLGGTPGAPGSYGYGTGSTYVIFGGTLQGVGYAAISDSNVSAYIDIAGTGYGNARAIANVTVDASKKIYADWDFTGYAPGAFSYATIQVYNFDTGLLEFQYGPGTSGAGVSIILSPGVNYQLVVVADADAPAFMWGGFSKPVPTPGALAVLGLGALGVRRRRRS